MIGDDGGRFQLPPGKDHRWRVSAPGRSAATLTASSAYWARERASVLFQCPLMQVRVELVLRGGAR